MNEQQAIACTGVVEDSDRALHCAGEAALVGTLQRMMMTDALACRQEEVHAEVDSLQHLLLPVAFCSGPSFHGRCHANARS